MESLEIDMRERGLMTALGERVTYRQENLVIGDLLFVFPMEHRLCIERKTWCDLWSSITDGRFREQRARLLEWSRASPSQHHVLYLIEGKPEDVGTTPRDTCLKTIHRLAILYGFAVWRTKSIKESADYVVWLTEQKTLFKNIEDTVTTRIEDLSRTMAKTKKDVQTPRHYLLAFLQSVSGISSAMAGAIAGESSSLQEFFEKCKKCEVVVVTEEEEKPVPVASVAPVAPEEETPTIKKKIPKKKKSAKTGPTGAEGFLAEIPIPVTDGTKTRKLGVERAKKILSSLGLATDPYRGEVAAMTSTASRTSST
uniref:ERCC4 domain-containing protein n=1 Tax=viral metagenome TaxID=1070528 RepID=A0A6C0K6E8_9ZZZZ